VSNIGGLVERMVAAGMSVGEASSIAAEIYAAGVAAASIRSSGAERTRRWREKKGVTNRHQTSHGDADVDASPTVTERHRASQCDANAKVPIPIRDIKEDRRLKSAASRGTRLNPSWTPSDAGRAYARQEGFSEAETDREVLQFRDYWIAAAGSKAVKLDWDAAWRTWLRRSADMKGKTGPPAVSQSDKLDLEEAVKMFARTGRWSRYAPCGEPGQSNCTVPPEMFAKYGLLPDGRKAA
jgi:hypothetical protein